MNQAFSGGAVFLVDTLLTLATIFFLLRFVLQAVRADFYNPITQGIVRLTDPVLKPLRRVVPPVGGLDSAALLLCILLQTLLLLFLGAAPVTAVLAAGFRLVDLLLDLYWFALIILVVASWIAPGNRHPGLELLYQVTEPVVAPFRRLIPPMGGLDLSIIFVFLALSLVANYLLPGITLELGLYPAVYG